MDLKLLEKPEITITVSDVIEYMFCPRFIYFMYSLAIPQHEEQRFKVIKGRKIHSLRTQLDKDYIRKKIDVNRKEVDVYLSSKKHHIRGIIDEVLFLADGTAAPLDYKYAKFNNKLFQTYKNQIILYGMMIQEVYNIKVTRGFICYTRSNNLIKEITITQKDMDISINKINEILDIIQKGYFPKKTKYIKKCIDCCYRNICV